MRKILACSSIRSDYDLMSPLYRLLHLDPEINLRLLVSGSHLAESHGYSVQQIHDDKLDILLEIETLLAADTKISRIKSASLLLQNSIETIGKFNPDVILYAGDREDILVYAMLGGYLGIPTVHFYSGDHASDGYIDNPVRHAASKLSTMHFVALPEHQKRLLRIGEPKERIRVIGNMALDRFVDFVPFSMTEIRERMKFTSIPDNFALVIFHPITAEKEQSHIYFENILQSLQQCNIAAFISYPNADPGNHALVRIIDQYKQHGQFIFYKNLERDIFLSIYKQAKFIIGNSSSGICEAASIPLPAINVGLRQQGRFADENVIFCDTSIDAISNAINHVLSADFQRLLRTVRNSYGDGHSAQRAYSLLKHLDCQVEKPEDPLKVEIYA